jgi:hypothetical protein
MFPNSYYPSTYFNASYWPKVGAEGAEPPGSGVSTLLLLLGVGCWLLFAVLPH